MWGRQRDLYSTYKRVSSKEHLNGYAREESLGRSASGVRKEIGNPSWKRPLLVYLWQHLIILVWLSPRGWVVNDTLESMSLELSFSGSTLAEGLVVSACLGGAFVGSIFSGWTADGLVVAGHSSCVLYQ